jgi:hypothetical protein
MSTSGFTEVGEGQDPRAAIEAEKKAALARGDAQIRAITDAVRERVPGDFPPEVAEEDIFSVLDSPPQRDMYAALQRRELYEEDLRRYETKLNEAYGEFSRKLRDAVASILPNGRLTSANKEGAGEEFKRLFAFADQLAKLSSKDGFSGLSRIPEDAIRLKVVVEEVQKLIDKRRAEYEVERKL